jgi:N4-gp56 family major capsid protein
MVFQWKPDIPAGVMRNRALSSEMRFASVAACKVLQFVSDVGGYGRKQGDTITIPRARNIAEPTTAILSRNQKIPIDSQQLAATSITVSKFGRGVEYDEETELLSAFNPKDFIQKNLIKQMKLVTDSYYASIFKRSPIRFAPTSSVAGTFTTDAGGSTNQATANLSVAHVKTIRDYMAATIHLEPYEADRWMCMAATKAMRGIRDDNEFAFWHQYNDPEMVFYRGEVGEIEKIRFMEVTHANALSNGVGSGSVLGEAIFFGEEPVVSAVVLDPELRAPFAGNFGLQRAIAWYGMFAGGLVWDDSANDGECRTIYVTNTD